MDNMEKHVVSDLFLASFSDAIHFLLSPSSFSLYLL